MRLPISVFCSLCLLTAASALNKPYYILDVEPTHLTWGPPDHSFNVSLNFQSVNSDFVTATVYFKTISHPRGTIDFRTIPNRGFRLYGVDETDALHEITLQIPSRLSHQPIAIAPKQVAAINAAFSINHFGKYNRYIIAAPVINDGKIVYVFSQIEPAPIKDTAEQGAAANP